MLKQLVNPMWFLALLVGAFGLVSCGDKDESLQVPTINFDAAGIGNDVTINAGQSVRFKGTFRKGSEGKDLKEVGIYNNTTGRAQIWRKTNLSGSQQNEVSYDTTLTLPLSGDSATYIILFEAIAKDNKVANRSIRVTVRKPVGPVEPTAPKFLGSVAFSNSNAYLNSASGNAAPLTQAQANSQAADIDLVYYWRSTDPKSHSFISPSALRAAPYTGTPAEWANGTVATEFRTTSASVADFNDAKADQSKIAGIVIAGALSTFTGNSPGVRVGGDTDFAANKVIAFTAKGKRGLILVRSVATTGGATVDIIVEN